MPRPYNMTLPDRGALGNGFGSLVVSGLGAIPTLSDLGIEDPNYPYFSYADVMSMQRGGGTTVGKWLSDNGTLVLVGGIVGLLLFRGR